VPQFQLRLQLDVWKNKASPRKNVDDLLEAKRQETETPAWFQQKHPKALLTSVAYFSMEFISNGMG
jgi:hypothetical protein